MRIIRALIVTLALALALPALAPPLPANAAVAVVITIAPPVLPVYAQPIIPGPGYIWTPGYWAWGPFGYYWVPGTWVLPPAVGLLWTPGYWAWGGSSFFWHAGYWGPRVGYYGGINYGYGYFGSGYEGGHWDRGVFFYNREVSNVNVNYIHNTYSKTVIRNENVNRTSFNGGNGGINARPNADDDAANRDRHRKATGEQNQHERRAGTTGNMRASVNNGAPSVAGTQRAGQFSGRGVTAANGSQPQQPHGGQPKPQQQQQQSHQQGQRGGQQEEHR